MSHESLKNFEYDVEYYEGFYSFRNEQVEVLMDEATFDRYWHTYLVRHGIETRTNDELMVYAARVDRQHFEAEQVLHNPDYWLQVCDPSIRIIQLKSICQPMQTDETDTTSKREE